MRILVGGAAAVAFALGTMSAGGAAQCTMAGMMMHPMPHCTAKTGPVVWFMASTKAYYLKDSSAYGKGSGAYVCRATAVARGGHPGPHVGGAHGTMGGSHGTMGGSHGAPMPMTMTMAPRPMTSATPSPSGGNPMSGNQGNTGAPGAGGQVPNNPASSSNNNPSPSPSPRP
jgi:hypothetical protein